MSSQAEDIIRETLSGVAKVIGVRIDIPDEMITDLAATLQAEIDRLEAVETESFEFLNELALAFRAAENHPRPEYAPVLEGIRAVLAHLTAAGRLIPAGGMALTAEQVEDVRAAREELRGYRNFTGYGRSHVNQLIAAVDALFPATEPAEEVKPVHPRPNVGDWGYGGGAAVYAPEVRCKTREELLSEKVEQLQAQVRHLSRVAANAAEHGIPAPAEPAEEETKAERGPEWFREIADAVDEIEKIPGMYHSMTLRSWAGVFRNHADTIELASSPVVPAPNETGPWQRIEDVPKNVMVRGTDGTWRGDPDGWLRSPGARASANQCAPFVAAKEG